ncbi:hypothetical protein ABPG72_021633 [Tetrahymena utriculariae]
MSHIRSESQVDDVQIIIDSFSAQKKSQNDVSKDLKETDKEEDEFIITICGKVKSRPYVVWEPSLSQKKNYISNQNALTLQYLITEQKQLLQKFDQISQKKCWCFDQDKKEVEKTVKNINNSKVYQHTTEDQQILEQNQAVKANEIMNKQVQVQNNNNQINGQIEDLSLSIFSNANTIAENQLNQQIEEVNKAVNLSLSKNQSTIQEESHLNNLILPTKINLKERQIEETNQIVQNQQQSQQITTVNNQHISNPPQLNQSNIENANTLIVLNGQDVNKQQSYGQSRIFQQTINIYDSKNESGDEIDSEQKKIKDTKKQSLHIIRKCSKQQQVKQEYQRLRQLSGSNTCSNTNNCEVCEYQICMKCLINRVLPDCSCALGFIEQNGTCVKCPDNCQICSDSSTCTTCNQQYYLVKGQCFCPTPLKGPFCSDPNKLTYTAFAGADLQSIELVFSDIIRINGVQLENQQFEGLISNCNILDSFSLAFYDLTLQPSIPNQGCYIKQNRQNVFVMIVGNQNVQQQLILPKINPQNISIYEYGQSKNVESVETNQSNILIQLNYMAKSCYFAYSSLITNNQYFSTLNIPFTITQSNVQIICQLIQPLGMSINFDCSSQKSLSLRTQTMFKDQDQILIQISCKNMFSITTNDQILITIANDLNKLIISYQNYDTLYLLNQQFMTGFQYPQGINQYGDLTIQISSIPQIFTVEPQQLPQSTYTISIPPYSYNTDGFVILKILVYNTDKSLVNTKYFLFSYQSSFSLSISQQKPSSSQLRLVAQVKDNDSTTTDLSKFQAQWFCFDNQQLPCSQNGVQLVFNSGFIISLQNSYITPNSQYQFVVYVYRVNDQSACQQAVNIIQGPQVLLTYTVSNTQSNNVNLISSQENVTIRMNYVVNGSNQNSNIQYLITMTDLNSSQKKIISNSSTIIFCVQDYFPVLSFSLFIPTYINLAFSVHDYNLDYDINGNPLSLQIRTPPLGCSITFGTTNQIIGFKDQVLIMTDNCQLNALNGPFTYQYFFYQNANQIQLEIMNPSVIQRQQLSLMQIGTQITTTLPPGNLYIMVIVQDQYSVSANFTQTISVSNNNFSTSDYEQTNSQYKPSDSINTLKNDLIQRLSDTSWQNVSQDAYLLSQQLKLVILQSKIQVSIQLSQNFKAQEEQAITNILQQISQADLSKLSTSQRIYYKQILTYLIQNFMLNVNNINSWTPSDCQNIIQQTSNALGGISQVMMLNEPELIFNTISSQLQAEKLDYTTLMQKYFNTTNNSNATASQLSLNYHIHIQTYPTDSQLYRNELSDFNTPYNQNATSQETLSLLQKTYPIIIPSIMTDQKLSKARFLSLQEGQINSPILIQFGQISDEEKLKCIQRSTSGKWVSNSCKAIVQIVNNKRQIICSCNKPDVTSIIADIDQLFDNQNIKDIFSGSGIERLLHLDGWYKYAPIWTIIGLNIFLIIIIIIGFKLDKRDNHYILKKVFLLKKYRQVDSYKNSFVSEKNSNNYNLFIQIKSKYKTGSPSQQGTPKNQQVKTEQKEQEKNQINIKKSQFVQLKVEDDINTPKTPNNEKKDDTNKINDNSQAKQQQLITNNAPQSQILNINNFKLESQEQVQILNIPEINSMREAQQNDQEELHLNKDNIINQNFDSKDQQQQIETQQKVIQNENQSEKDYTVNNFYFETQPKLNEINLFTKKDTYQNELFTNDFNTPSPTNKNKNEITLVDKFQLGNQKEKENKQIDQLSHLTNVGIEQNKVELKNSEKSIPKIQINQEQFLISSHQANDIVLHIQRNEIQNSQLAWCSPNTFKGTQNEQEIKILDSQIQNIRLDKSEGMNDSKKVLKNQKNIKKRYCCALAFHIFFQAFIVYDEKFSRAIRFIIYYNKIVWLLALNSIFGVNLSVIQIVVLSITSTIVLLIVTTIITALLSKQKLKVIGIIITSLFLLFCYYSILVVISGQDPYEANIWIGSYFLTLFINEYLLGVPTCFAMYSISKQVLNKVENPIILQILGTGLLIEAFKS